MDRQVIVALPRFGDSIAPCFEAARVFLIARIEDNFVVSRRVAECEGCEGFNRVQLLKDLKVNVLICNGIKDFYRNLLGAAGISIISNLSASVESALEGYAGGGLFPDTDAIRPVEQEPEVPLEDLVCWTTELFTAHGYEVRPGAEYAPFPVDLVAEIKCPVCGRPVRVAICCGAHTYRPEQEIQQLHLVAAGGYHARVYVRSATPRIRACCREYAIELIDPDAKFASRDHPVEGRIPILQMAVSGHEAASEQGNHERQS